MTPTIESEFVGIRLRTFKDGWRWSTIWPSDQDPSGLKNKKALESRAWTQRGSIRKAQRILAYRYFVAYLNENLPDIYRLCYTSRMTKMTIMVGIPGSGKSTLAERMRNATVISSDEIRARVTGDPTMQDQSKNDQVFRVFAQDIRKALRAGKHVVVDSTAVTRRAQELLLDIAREFHLKPTVVMFTNTEVARQRNKDRWRVVPDHVMDNMEENLRDIQHYFRENAKKYERIIEAP